MLWLRLWNLGVGRRLFPRCIVHTPWWANVGGFRGLYSLNVVWKGTVKSLVLHGSASFSWGVKCFVLSLCPDVNKCLQLGMWINAYSWAKNCFFLFAGSSQKLKKISSVWVEPNLKSLVNQRPFQVERNMLFDPNLSVSGHFKKN